MRDLAPSPRPGLRGDGRSLLEDLGEALARGLVLLNAQARICECSQRGARMLRDYFPGSSFAAGRLPAPIAVWVDRVVSERKPRARAPLHIVGPPGRLMLSLQTRQAVQGYLLVLEERPHQPPSALLAELGLTPREGAISAWLAQGKTNPEIALILDANVNTVRVHVQHIITKLGVETRTAAALRIAECWRAE